MLVLADADALGVYLHQLGQRVLQTPRDADRAAQADVHVGQFLAGEFAGRIDRSSGLADDDLFDLHIGRHRLDALDQIAGQLVGFPAGRAIADGDQVHAVRGHQAAQAVQRAFPVHARFVREDGRGVQHTAGIADHGHLHAGADTGVQAHHHALAGGGGQEKVAQVVGEDLDGHGLGVFTQAAKQVALQAQAELDLPGPGHGLADQFVGGALGVAPAQMNRDATFGHRRSAGDDFLVEHQLGVQPFVGAATKNRQRAVAGHGAYGFGVVEVVAELGGIGVVAVLAFHQLALQLGLGPQPGAQLADQHRVFGPAFAEQVAHAVEHGVSVGETGGGQGGLSAFICIREGCGLGGRVQRGVGKQLVGQRFQTGFAGDHAFGAALLLVGQVQVFQLLLGRRGVDQQAQFRRQLALLVDALQHRLAAVFQFADVGQPGFQFTQLDVVQAVRRFFAVAGDEGNGGAAVEQFNGG